MTMSVREELQEKIVELKKHLTYYETLLLKTPVNAWVNPVGDFLRDEFEFNGIGDIIKWHVWACNMRGYYEQYCKDHDKTALRIIDFNRCVEAFIGIGKTSISIKIPVTNIKAGFIWKTIRVIEGLRRKDTSGIIKSANPEDK